MSEFDDSIPIVGGCRPDRPQRGSMSSVSRRSHRVRNLNSRVLDESKANVLDVCAHREFVEIHLAFRDLDASSVGGPTELKQRPLIGFARSRQQADNRTT